MTDIKYVSQNTLYNKTGIIFNIHSYQKLLYIVCFDFFERSFDFFKVYVFIYL